MLTICCRAVIISSVIASVAFETILMFLAWLVVIFIYYLDLLVWDYIVKVSTND